MSDNTHVLITTQENRSQGGKARAAKLSSEERSAIAKKANLSKKCYEGIKKAPFYDKFKVGDIEIDCAVLENGVSVITEASMYRLFGMKGGGRKNRGGAQLPRFLSHQTLQVYIPECLKGCPESFKIITKNGVAYAYEAEKVPKILKVFLDARNGGVLNPVILALAKTAEILLQSFAQVGIIGIIHEVTGYQEVRERDELNKILEKYISEELRKWTPKFPKEFFDQVFRIYGWEKATGNNRPQCLGNFINKYIYGKLPDGVLKKLIEKNPVTESGFRKHCHHQYVSEDIGEDNLKKQIVQTITVMKLSDDINDFKKLIGKI